MKLLDFFWEIGTQNLTEFVLFFLNHIESWCSQGQASWLGRGDQDPRSNSNATSGALLVLLVWRVNAVNGDVFKKMGIMSEPGRMCIAFTYLPIHVLANRVKNTKEAHHVTQWNIKENSAIARPSKRVWREGGCIWAWNQHRSGTPKRTDRGWLLRLIIQLTRARVSGMTSRFSGSVQSV